MSNFLFVYEVPLVFGSGDIHLDPVLDEFSYGDVSNRADWMLNTWTKGDRVFFHASKNGRRFITCMFLIDRVLDGNTARGNKTITSKYRNPHLSPSFQGTHDAIAFGDPHHSQIFNPPVLFDRSLAMKLTSIRIQFPNTGETDLQRINSHTRNLRRSITDREVKAILNSPRVNP